MVALYFCPRIWDPDFSDLRHLTFDFRSHLLRPSGRAPGIVVSKLQFGRCFIAEFISATLNKMGEVIEGDPKQVRQITDVWTFERDTSSRDPNWKLVATDEPG